jgi:TPR repeat protein
MKHLILLLVAGLLASPAQAQLMDSKFESIVQMYEDEERGLRHYERGDYDKAFEYLSETAARGLKKSQYILAFMFLKGEHVDKSILLGMGWLGVAAESGDEEWIKLYDGLYGRASPAQQVMIDSKVEQYKRQYGAKTMNVSCALQPVTGSRRQEYRCLKTEGPAYTIYPVEMSP